IDHLSSPAPTMACTFSLHDALPIYLKLGNMFRFYQAVELVTAYFDDEKIQADNTATPGMPERFREELIKNFLEPLGWCYEMRYRSEEHTSELQSRENLVCRLLLEKK